MLATTPRTRQFHLIEKSAGLLWARQNLGERDLVLGWNTLGASYFLRRDTVSLYAVPAPEPRAFALEHVCLVARSARAAGFDRVYLMVHTPDTEQPELRAAQGEFLTSLVREGVEAHPGLEEVVRLSDSAFFAATGCP
jgi:hypothetical protein